MMKQGRILLIRRSFDFRSKRFIKELIDMLKSYNIQVATQTTNFISCHFRKHHTYNLAIGIDFFRDFNDGAAVTVNSRASKLSLQFAYSLSSALDDFTPTIRWRGFSFVSSYDRNWFKFFNGVSADSKLIFYLCTLTNRNEVECFENERKNIEQAFASEIVRYIRNASDVERYVRQSQIARVNMRRFMKKKKTQQK